MGIAHGARGMEHVVKWFKPLNSSNTEVRSRRSEVSFTPDLWPLTSDLDGGGLERFDDMHFAPCPWDSAS